jgi:hypothetical protein
MINGTISHYEAVEMLGEGGMGPCLILGEPPLARSAPSIT